MIKLLIDAGNTRIKWAITQNDEWLHQGVIPTVQASDLPKQLTNITEVKQIWVSNVAGGEVAQQLCKISEVQPHFITARDQQCGVQNSYVNPAQLGSDRWAALIAAWHLMHQECLVVNCGTATTVDALTAQGEFIGGLILPGVGLMQQSLLAGTAQLATDQGKYVMFPLNTADAIASGALQAGCGAIQRQYALLKNCNAPIVLSGGAAHMLQTHLEFAPLRVVDNLVLQGLMLIANEANR